MARPSMPNRTRMSSAIKTIAWPACKLRLARLVGVLGPVDSICGDDDVVADNLLDEGSDWLERVPERHLDRLVSDCGLNGIASRAWGGIQAEPAARTVRVAVAG